MNRIGLVALMAAALSGMGCKRGPSEELVPVLVASRPLKEGTVVTTDDLAVRPVPAGLITSSVVKPDVSSYVINQRLGVPVAKGEPVQWAMFLTTVNPDTCSTPQERRPPFPRQEPTMSEDALRVLAYSQDLAEGTVLDANMLAVREVQQQFVSPYAALEGEVNLVLGQRLRTPVQAGDLTLLSALPRFQHRKLCEWAFELNGNRWKKGPPPSAAAAITCPQGTRRLEGVPGGAKWKTPAPGWAVLCLDGKGRRHGPVAAWDRINDQVAISGAYENGAKDGPWRWTPHGDPAEEQREVWKAGKLEGELQHGRSERGTLVAGLRQGSFELNGVRAATFDKGLPTGTWQTADGTSFDPAQREESTVEFVVALRDLEAGTRLQFEDITRVALPAQLAQLGFVKADNAAYVVKESLRVSTPKGAPILWCDFNPSAEIADPVPLTPAEAAPPKQ